MSILELICWCCILKHRGGGVVSGWKPLTQPLNYSKNKKRPHSKHSKIFFKTKKEIHMQTLKIISMIYTAWVLIRFVWLDCKSGDASESVIYKILSLLQSVVLAYIIIK